MSLLQLWAFGPVIEWNLPILTYSMVQSPSWEANWFAASQEIPRISRNPKVHYRTHKRPPPVSILGQPNPAHIPTSHFLEIHPNIIHPSTPRSPQWFLPSGFPTKTLYTPLSSPIRATWLKFLIQLLLLHLVGCLYYNTYRIYVWEPRGWESQRPCLKWEMRVKFRFGDSGENGELENWL